MGRIMISLRSTNHASTSADTDSSKVLAALTLMALSLYDGEHNYPFAKLKLDARYASYLTEGSKALLRKWGISTAFAAAHRTFKAEGWRFDEDSAAELSKAIGKALPKIKADVANVSAAQLTYLTKIRTYLNKDSAPAWKYIVNNVKVIGDNGVATVFVDMIDDVAPDTVGSAEIDTTRMRRIVKRLTGRNEAIITPIELSTHNEDNPKLVAEYRALFKALNDKFKVELRKFVRSSGKDKVSVDLAAKHLEAKGCNALPKGFKGFVGEDNKYYTSTGHLIGGAIVGTVVMNPNYDPKKDNTYVCSSVGVGRVGRPQAWRTLNFVHDNQIKRFAAVKEAAQDVTKFRRKWAADLTKDGTKEQVLAALVETAHTTLARIGGLNNKTETGEPTYGLSTLLAQHVKVDAKGAHFDYAGKKGTGQAATLYPRDPTMKRAINVIRELKADTGRNDHLFTYDGKRITAREANLYMRSLGMPQKFTIHKFRHLAGTNMFGEIIAKAPFKKGDPKTTQAAVEKWYRAAMIPIGKALHHRTGEKVTGMTAVGAYIDLTPQRDFFKDLGLREPTFLAKKKAA